MPYFGIARGPLAPLWRALGYRDFRTLPYGIAFAGEKHPTESMALLVDQTWSDDEGIFHLDHEIFDNILSMIGAARRLIVLDMFLFNALLTRDQVPQRRLTDELTDALVEKKATVPGIEIVFITDPCNTAYGGLPNPYFERLRDAGIRLIVTDLDPLRDSSPVYSFLWRAFVRPFGNSLGGPLHNPFGGGGSISIRSFLGIFNIKANHRKTLLADDGETWHGLVTTANPHNASFAHRNVALRFAGPAVADLFLTEKAVMEMCGEPVPALAFEPTAENGPARLQVLTERCIKDAVLELIDGTADGDSIDLILFYLADRDILAALHHAKDRGVTIRMILDPNKDAFGWSKTGIPNRPVAAELHAAGIQIRWAATHGEQCHSKLMCAHRRDGKSSLILGSANFTRRNLDNFNLETDVLVEGPSDSPVLVRTSEVFEQTWHNDGGRQFTVDYETYEARARWLHWLYWFMEATGISTY
ncbi:MAG: phospholipase [Pseudomonadales bacterium]|nr:phospholipase [Pseudomonadales bacterium]